MATIGTILIQAANASGSITGPNAPSIAGGGGGGASDDLRSQKKREEFEKKNLEQGEKAPKFWTAAFKKMGIQMGLAGILKQSQIFTSSVGAIFQIFGAFVDVILAPFVPLFIPAIRWLARQLPTVAKGAQATADAMSKGIKAVWGWFFGGKFKENVKSLFTDLSSGIVDGIKTAFSWLTDNPFTNWVADFTKGIWNGIKDWYDATLSGRRIAMADGGIIGKIGFTFPGGGGGAGSGEAGSGSSGGVTPKAPPKPTGPSITNPLTGAKMPIPGGSHMPFAGDDEGWQDWALAAGGTYGVAKTAQVGLTSAKLRNFRNPMMDDGRGGKIPKKGAGWLRKSTGFMQDWEMNPLRKIPGTGVAKMVANAIVKPPELVAKATAGLVKNVFGGVGDMAAGGGTPMGPMRFGGPGTAGFGDDLGQMNQRMPRGASFGDDLAQVKGTSPTKLSRAVNAFNGWVKKTGSKLKSAAGSGPRAFQSVYDEGLSLADDVVKLAKVTPGMGVVGKIVSVGFKRVIPGVAGAYMVGETIQDVWKIVKSDAPWLGDWKSLDAYKAEAMGAIFGGKSSLLGGLTSTAGWVQKKMGFGDSISDWQKGIQENQKEKGVLSSGKLMDAIIRGTTGIGGAALSTFFPGLGTLAGTALYEGGRYATTGVNVPGLGQLGGDVEKYGAATDFSDTIIKAIESGWSKGVNMVEIR